MIRSLYSGVSGMKNHQTRMDVIANNISNVNTTAFKASRVSFQDMIGQIIAGSGFSGTSNLSINSAQVGIGSSVSDIKSSFVQGALQYTGRALDVAIRGNGFITLKDVNQDGKENFYFTRDGSFNFDKDGYLVNSKGFKVLDAEGNEIQVTESIHTVGVDRSGTLTAYNADGDVVLNQKIGLSYILNPNSLLKAGDNMFTHTIATNFASGQADHGLGAAGTSGRGIFEPMALETSNVELTDEFADMMVTQRGYQANARVVTTSDQMLEELINLKR